MSVLIICAAIMLIWISRQDLPGSLKNRYKNLGVLLIAIFLVVYVVPSAYRRFHPDEHYGGNWRNVQLWAKGNTKKDALFLTPPYMTGFRIFSQRPIIGEWKDGTQQYFDVDYSYEWWRRMQDLKSDSWADRDFDSLDEKQYMELAKKYGASYLVVPAKVSLSLHKEYENGGYAVYRFNGIN